MAQWLHIRKRSMLGTDESDFDGGSYPRYGLKRLPFFQHDTVEDRIPGIPKWQPETGTHCRLSCLPSELLHSITAYLDTCSVANLRLTCKSLGEVGKEHLVQEVCFFLDSESVRKVKEISLDPDWSPRVKRLVFELVEPTSYHVYDTCKSTRQIWVCGYRRRREGNPKD